MEHAQIVKRTPPVIADLAKTLKDQLIEQDLDEDIAGEIAGYLDHVPASPVALIERLQDKGLNPAQLKVISVFVSEMADEADYWRPSMHDFHLSAEEHQQKRTVYPGLDNARWRLETLLAGYVAL